MLDVREELKWAEEKAKAAMPTALARRRALPSWALLGVGALTGAALVASLLWWRRADQIDTAPAPRARFTIPLAEGESLHAYSSASLAISPDGARIAYSANRGSERSLYIRALAELESRRLAGTERANDPIFSPDGEWIAFEAAGKLKKVSLKGGTPQFLANLAWFGGHSWGPGDIIVYTPAFTGGLFAISAQGGKPRRLTTPDKNQAHLWPEVLPDGKTVLFTLWRGEKTFDQPHVGVLSLETGKWKVVIDGGAYPRYAPTGHLLFVRGGTLFAAPFDLREQEVTGASVSVLEDGVHQIYVRSADGTGDDDQVTTGEHNHYLCALGMARLWPMPSFIPTPAPICGWSSRRERAKRGPF